MTIAIGQTQQTAVDERGLFDLVDDWLKRDRFVFIVGRVFYYSQQHSLQ